MGQVYDKLDEQLAAYKNAHPKVHEYDAVPAQMKAIHLPLSPQIESLNRETLSKTRTDAQRQRRQMFSDKLVLLHWNLRQAGWLE